MRPDEQSISQPVGTQTLGRYRLLRLLGRGGMGEVWLGEDPKLRRQVAIKTLPVHTQGDQEYLQRFEREAHAAAALNHPHILPVHDYGEERLANGQAISYLVMPYVPGGSLSDRISRVANNRQAMPQQEALHYLSQAAEAIDYAHTQGVIHRDVKPANMLLRNDGWLLLADFGIARMLGEQNRLTQTGVGFGTPEYMAPEQAQGRAEPASDNYSLAVIAYQLFTGRVPFKADTPYATTIQHIISPPPPPRQINPALSPAIETILLQGLAKNPEQRLPSARAFINALQQAAASAPYESTFFQQAPAVAGYADPAITGANALTPPNTPSINQGITRRNLLIGVGAAALVAGAGLGTWAFVSHQGQQNPSQTRGSASTSRTSTTKSSTAPDFILQGHNKDVTTIGWSPSSSQINRLISIGLDGQALAWNIPTPTNQTQTLKPIGLQSPGVTDVTMLLAWSPDGSAVAIGNVSSGSTNIDLTHGYVSFYKNDMSGMAFNLTAPVQLTGSNVLNAMSWFPGQYLIIANNLSTPDSQLITQFTLFDPLHSTRPLNTATRPFYISETRAYPASVMVPSPADPSTLAIATTGGANDAITLAHLTPSLKPTINLLTNQLQLFGPSGAAWSSDGNFLAAFCYDHTLNSSSIVVWSKLDNYSKVNAPTLASGFTVDLTALAWSPTSNYLLAAGDVNGNIHIWKYYPGPSASGNRLPILTLAGPKNAKVTALAWSIDGNWLAAGYNDLNDSIYIWNSSFWS
jgi:serine/threonine protein kinase